MSWVSIVILAWQFGPYIAVFFSLWLTCGFWARLKPVGKVVLVTIFVFAIASLVAVSVAYFRAEAGARIVAITRFPGDGGFRELKASVELPELTIDSFVTGKAAMGTPSDRLGLETQLGTVPYLRTVRVPLSTTAGISPSLSIWLAPPGAIDLTGGNSPVRGVFGGIFLQDAAEIAADGTVVTVGPAARVVGFATRGFGLVDQTTPLAPAACSSASGAARGGANTVCGVSAWVAAQAVSLGDRGTQIPALLATQRTIRGMLATLNATDPEVAATATDTSVASVVVQVTAVKDLLNKRRADVAFANDVYVVYISIGVVLHVGLLLAAADNVFCGVQSRLKRACMRTSSDANADDSKGEGSSESSARYAPSDGARSANPAWAK